MGVTVRQKVKGKGEPWWVFIAHNNKRTSRMIGDKKAAEEVASKIRAKLELGEFDFEQEKKEEPKVSTFKEYADSWITTIAPATCKESTVSSYDDLLRLHILPVFETLRLNEINRGKLKDFFASKILEGYAKSSVIHMKNVISGIMTKAVDDEVIPTNLSLGIKIAQMKRNGDEENKNSDGDDKADPLSAEETSLLLDIVKADSSKPYPLASHYPLFLLLVRTGLRIGEALALKWGDIDFNGRFIHIQRGLSRMKIQTPKNGKTRRVDMSPHLVETLRTHKVKCEKKGEGRTHSAEKVVPLTAYKIECEKKDLAPGLGDAPEYVFTNEKGGFIDLSNWRRRIFNKALDKAKLRRIRIHDLRHYAEFRIMPSTYSNPR
jgi:integrase